MIDVEVLADTRWLAVPLDPAVDLEAWAAESAAAAYDVRDTEPSADDLATTAAVYAGLGRLVRDAAADRDQPLEAVFALTAAEDPLPVTVATGRRLGFPSTSSSDDVIASIVLPDERRYDPPEIEEIDTPAGPATRIVQHVLAPMDDGDGTTVHEWQVYVWLLPDAESALLMSVEFVDLMDAAVFDEDVRHLVEGVRIKP